MKGYRILDRYVAKELMGPFFFGVMAFTLIMVAGGLLFKLADLIIEQGISLSIAGRLFLYELPSVVVLTLPMSCLLGSLLGFGSMSSNSEVVALKAAGISFMRISRPVLFWSVLVSLLSLGLNETLVPLGKQAFQNVMRYEVVREKPALLKEQVFLRSPGSNGENRVVYIDKLQPRDGTMEHVIVQEFEQGVMQRITVAQKGQWVDGSWHLYDGSVFQVLKDNRVEQQLHFKEQTLPLPLSPGQIGKATVKPDNMSILELLPYISAMKLQGVNLAPLWVSFHLKLALPWACVILAMVGATLGVHSSRKGGASVGFGQSVLLVFVYYVIMSMGRSFGQTGAIPPILAAWLPNIMFFVAAFVLVRRADQ